MSEKHETRSDIVAEMRKLCELYENSTDKIPRSLMGLGLRTYADRFEAAWKRERDEMLDTIVRIGNWCALDLAENAYVSDISGNYLKTLIGLCEVCRPFMRRKGGAK